jgi:hypothetical protein
MDLQLIIREAHILRIVNRDTGGVLFTALAERNEAENGVNELETRAIVDRLLKRELLFSDRGSRGEVLFTSRMGRRALLIYDHDHIVEAR